MEALPQIESLQGNGPPPTEPSASPQPGCSYGDKDDIIMENISAKSDTQSFMPSGRRLFDVKYLFSQIFNQERHKPFDCNITFMEVTAETRRGLYSIFVLKCKMCGVIKELSSECSENTDNIEINTALTLAAVSTGIGYSCLNEVAAAINLPMMSEKTYSERHNQASEIIRKTAWSIMEEAAKEEAKMAVELGEVSKDGIPYITVVTDGAWSKRSYNVNYDALSGVGSIVGYRTSQLLYLGVRNKYCTMCARAQSRQEDVPVHRCFKNWDKSSTAMETDIILEGFLRSIELYNIRFLRMIGDGDSSVYRKLVQVKPYGNLTVEKVECKNHLLRNFSTKLREVATRKRSSSKNLPVPPYLRKEITKNALRLRISVVKATEYRRNQDISNIDKMELLKEDILNVPSHIFGEHKRCAEIGYFQCSPKANEKNLIPEMKECGLYGDIETCLQRLLLNISSLLLNMNNNLAEHYNSLVSKFVGGKRINYSLRGSYQTRCEAAAIQFNAGDDYYNLMQDSFLKRRSQVYTQKYIIKRQKKKQATLKIKATRGKTCRKRNTFAPADKDYGPEAHELPLDIKSAEYKRKKEEFLDNISKNKEEIIKIEKETRGQSANPMWVQERSIRLTASNFGRVCKLRTSTNPANTVKSLLYSSFLGNDSTKYGNEHELTAIRAFEEIYKYKVYPCGLFISEQYPFLAASPDGLIEDDVIVEIKCPSVLAKMTPEMGIETKKVTFATITDGRIKLKRNHNYFYQVQGQLAISNRTKCFFCVWSPHGILVEEIFKEVNFWEKLMVPKLVKFYTENLLPELVDPMHTKGLPIRTAINSAETD